MPVSNPRIKANYTRSDHKGHFPWQHGMPELEHNRLAVFWRPIIDMTDSELAPMRLRMVRPIASWLAEPNVERWSRFAMIGVPGLRHQVIRHAGLNQYDSREPTDLSPDLWTQAWATLIAAIEQFHHLNDRLRALVIFQLAQLSYVEYGIQLAGLVIPNGYPEHDHYAYEVARVHARYPGHAPDALRVFASLGTSARNQALALMACFQGVGHTIRSARDLEQAQAFEERGLQIIAGSALHDDWDGCLAKSRFHRALALLRLKQDRPDDMRQELRIARDLDEEVFAQVADEIEEMVALENRRILLEAQLKAACRNDAYRAGIDVDSLCKELIAIDPNNVQVRLVVGDVNAACGHYSTAALWYTRAGELATTDGAVGWFRAAQCYDFIGDRWSAANAMGRCLELDTTAIEPRQYIASIPYSVCEVSANIDDPLLLVNG